MRTGTAASNAAVENRGDKSMACDCGL